MLRDYSTATVAIASLENENASTACSEEAARITRRSLLGLSAALFTSTFAPPVSSASETTDSRFLLVILRGGLDSLSFLVPKGDNNYLAARRHLAIPDELTLTVSSDFGLHPAMRQLHEMFHAGEASFAPAVGIPVRIRSHFECQKNLENGLPFNTASGTGWLNRLLGSLPSTSQIRKDSGLGVGEAPLILRGPEPVLSWSPSNFADVNRETVRLLKSVYRRRDPQLLRALNRGQRVDELASKADANLSNPSSLNASFVGAARIMRQDRGPRIAVISVEGWDMHLNQGPLTGRFNNLASELDDALGDFKREIGSSWENTVVMCVSEFGRTIEANGTYGTDHGIGTCSFMVGGAVEGGFIGDWPGLAPAARYEGDLYPATDLRAVFKSILNQHIGVPDDILDSIVFPGSAGVTVTSKVIGGPRRALRLASSFQRPLTLQDVSPIGRYRKRYGIAN